MAWYQTYRKRRSYESIDHPHGGGEGKTSGEETQFLHRTHQLKVIRHAPTKGRHP